MEERRGRRGGGADEWVGGREGGLQEVQRAPYLGLEIVGVVVGVLRVHWLLFQSLAHVAGILSTEAGNGDTGGKLLSS